MLESRGAGEGCGARCLVGLVGRRGPRPAAGEGREATHPDSEPLFITEQSGNFATITAQIWDHFPSNKTITL